MSKFNTLSLENNFISACKELFVDQKIQFFMFDKLDNVGNLKYYVLPKIKDKIEEEDLFFEGNVVNYDLTKLQINKYVKHDLSSLELELQYFNQKFNLTLKLDNNLTSDSYAEAFKQIVETKIANQLIFYEWETEQQHFTKVKDKIMDILQANNSLLFINTQKITLDYSKLSIIAINNSQISNKNIKVEYEYDNSDISLVKILLAEYISRSEFIKTWNDLTSNQLLINLSPSVTFENIWDDLKLNHWISQIVDFFKNKSFQIRTTKFEIKNENISLLLTDEIKNNAKFIPSTKKIILQINYAIAQAKIALDVTFKLNNEINQEKLKKAFFEKIKNLEINGMDFASAENEKIIHDYIAKQIVNFFENTVIFNGIKFFITTKNFFVNNYLIAYKNNKAMIKIQCESDLFSEAVFNVEVTIINFEMLMLNKIVKFLQKFNQNNAFDLNYIYNEENTWNDLLNEVKKKIVIDKFEKNIIDRITWSGFYKNDLDIKIKDDDFKDEVWKTVIVKYNNQSSSSVAIYFKNLKFLKDFVILENILNSFKERYSSNWKGKLMPRFVIGEEKSINYLGIEKEVDLDKILNSSEVICKFIIKNVNYKDGEVIVTLYLQKNKENVSKDILINDFAKTSYFFETIEEYFKNPISFEIHNLDNSSARSWALDTFKRLLEKQMGDNFHNVTALNLHGSMTDKIINTWKDNGDWFFVDVTINGETKKIYFSLKDVDDYQIRTFLNKITKPLILPESHKCYPHATINKGISLPDYGLGKYVWDDTLGLSFGFRVKEIDYQLGEMKIWGVVSKYGGRSGIKEISKYFDTTIKGFWTYETFKNKLIDYFSKDIDYPLHRVTTAFTRKQAYSNCQTIFRIAFDSSSYAIKDFNFIGNGDLPVVNTKGNRGDVFEVLINLGLKDDFIKITIKLKNVIEKDIITLKDQIIRNYRTTRKDFWVGNWKINQILSPNDLGIKLPSDLLGCRVELKAKYLSWNSVTLDLRIIKNSTEATFEYTVSGFKEYSVYLDELQKWLQQPFRLNFVGHSINKALKLSNTWEDLVNCIKKMASYHFKVPNLDHIVFFINDKEIDHKKKKISDLNIITFADSGVQMAEFKNYFFTYKNNQRIWKEMDKTKIFGFRDFAK